MAARKKKAADSVPVSRIQQKLIMIVGENNGDGSRTMERLARVLPKLDGDEIPPMVVEFIERMGVDLEVPEEPAPAPSEGETV